MIHLERSLYKLFYVGAHQLRFKKIFVLLPASYYKKSDRQNRLSLQEYYFPHEQRRKACPEIKGDHKPSNFSIILNYSWEIFS